MSDPTDELMLYTVTRNGKLVSSHFVLPEHMFAALDGVLDIICKTRSISLNDVARTKIQFAAGEYYSRRHLRETDLTPRSDKEKLRAFEKSIDLLISTYNKLTEQQLDGLADDFVGRFEMHSAFGRNIERQLNFPKTRTAAIRNFEAFMPSLLMFRSSLNWHPETSRTTKPQNQRAIILGQELLGVLLESKIDPTSALLVELMDAILSTIGAKTGNALNYVKAAKKSGPIHKPWKQQHPLPARKRQES